MRARVNCRNIFACLAAFNLWSCAEGSAHYSEKAIVSLSLCADGYLHALPEIEPNLTALSWQSRSVLSQTPDHLRVLPQTENHPEGLLKWAGALKVSTAGGQGDIDLDWGENFETVWKNFALLSSKLGTDDPSGTFRTRLKMIEKPSQAPKILYLDRSGGTAGPGTFVDAVIKAAGGKNVIENPGWQSPDIETLIRLQPDILLTSFMSSEYVGVSDKTSRHAALQTQISTLPVIDIPGKLWPCAGPGMVKATEILSQEMAKL